MKNQKENNKNANQLEKNEKKSNIIDEEKIITPLWLSVSEAAKIGGVQGKTIRRAIQSQSIRYKINGNRYFINFASLVKYLSSSTKLKNKLNNFGVGQYIDNWKE